MIRTGWMGFWMLASAAPLWPLPDAGAPAALEQAAAAGEAGAQFELGYSLVWGLERPADPAAGARWLRLAAEQGLPEAQSSYADLLARGQGVRQDEVAAVAWYRKAAAQGDLAGQYGLGRMYAEGRGVVADWNVANDWYASAAEGGFSAAQLEVGKSYALGRGRTKDLTCAWLWHGLAALSGWEFAAAERAGLELEMSAAELVSGRRLLARTVVPREGPIQRPLCADETVSLRLEKAPLVEVLAVFSQISGYEIVPPPETVEPIAIAVEDRSWQSALSEVLSPLGLTWILDGDRLLVVRPPA